MAQTVVSAAEGLLDGFESETDMTEYLTSPPRFNTQSEEETEGDLVPVGMENSSTLSEQTRDDSASAFVNLDSFRLQNDDGDEALIGERRHDVSQLRLTHTDEVPNEVHGDDSSTNTPLNVHELSQWQSPQFQADLGLQWHHGDAPTRLRYVGTPEDWKTKEDRTTVMLVNVPMSYTSSHLIRTIDSEGFADKYDFIYVPMTSGACTSSGFAFVNLVDASIAKKLFVEFDGFSRWTTISKHTCRAFWAKKQQGFSANVERYRNSFVKEENVPDEYKPRTFKHGMEVEFPPPFRMPCRSTVLT
eukprot:TRINITY_DN7573_c0_g1_i1.p1 TRINITY_DN7573_c0_g1~~TRINITY_DN7573_c0_g1_i1.p1  ORF type:complete len:302 (-),score=45.29 TRINITY_DN7573_c0_g1_i1:247-1152(-)